jgi:membrane-bound metal-dependent hydrolase YbcI (DUF457 family)
MSFGFVHLIGAWVFGKLYSYLTKKKLPRMAWFFLLLGGILPDIDLLFDWTLGLDYHRTFTHSFVFVLLIILITYSLSSLLNEKRGKHYALLIGAGCLIHIFLDLISLQGTTIFWPNLTFFSFISGFNVLNFPPLHERAISEIILMAKSLVVDMAIGVAWVFWLIVTKKLKF